MVKMFHLSALIVLIPLQTGITTTASSCTDCDGGNVTCVDGVCLPRCVNVTSSGECLQCQGSRFYGKQCENVCPHTCLNSRCQLNNSRVVCTEGCVVGKKGDNCGVDCLKECRHCERHGDRCVGSCSRLQYYGDYCDKLCGCRDGCDTDTGECYNCTSDYRGRYCNETCHMNCRDGCYKDTGECDSCISGYRDRYCNVTCPLNCKDGCDRTTGRCKNCETGKMGNYCNETCPSYCQNGCERDLGKCDCESGLRGTYCNDTCPSKCREGCDRITGECVSCILGYQGKYCDSYVGVGVDSNPVLKIVYGLVGVVVVLVSGLVISVLIGLRHRRRKRLQVTTEERPVQRTSDTSDNSDRNQYWSSKYWDIDDNDLDTDHLSYNELVPQRDSLLQQRGENNPNCPRKITSTEPSQSEVFTDRRHSSDSYQTEGHLSDVDCVLNNHLYTSADADTACALDVVKGSTSSCSAEFHNLPTRDTHPLQKEERLSEWSVTSEDLRLTTKTESMILWEKNADFSNVYVKYISANSSDDS